MGLETSDKSLKAAEGSGFDAVTHAGSVDFAPDDACIFKDFQVLGDGGLGQRQFIDDIAADAVIFADEDAQNLNAGGVADGFGELGEFGVGFGAFDGAKIGLGVGRRATGALGWTIHRRKTIKRWA